MLASLSEQAAEKERVITQAKEFVENFKSDVYLRQRREKNKAELGVSLSIFSPDRIFTTMNELIRSVNWVEYQTAQKQFRLLRAI